MAHCEYRIGNPSQGVKVQGVGEMSVVVSGGQPICRVQAEGGDFWPVCELPEESTETCPIAQFQKRNLTLEQTNQRLTNIFNARRASRGTQG